MKKKYIVYYRWDTTDGEDKCNHHFEEFDAIRDAVNRFDKLGTSEKYILKMVTWKTEVTDITEGA